MALPNLEIIRDDDHFNAAVVATGRFGIVYSYVLQVSRKYDLAEWTVKRPGIDVVAKLRESDGRRNPIETLLESIPNPSFSLNLHAIIPNYPHLPHFLSVTFNSAAPEDCYIMRRWRVPDRLPT